MTTTGTYDFNPAASALTLQALGRIGLRDTEITVQHLSKAAIEANLLQASISGNQPNLWRTEVYPITLVSGTATYDLPPRFVAIQDVYLSVTSDGVTADRLLWPLSFLEYDSQANKTQQAPPTCYLVNKLLSPTITFWQVPDDSTTYVANVRLLSRTQDASQINGATVDLPYIYLDVFVAGLAHRLSRFYARDQELIRKQDYLEALAIAQNTDTQDGVGLIIQPTLDGYWA